VTALLAPLFTSLVASLVATLGCERLARREGLVKQPREDRWHREPIPLLGGVAIMVGVLTAVVTVPGAVTRFGPFVAAALVMGLVGLLDDIRPLRPQAKLVAQIVLAAALMKFGFLLRLTASPLLNVFLTLFWIVGITNAFNLLDNMDGLAGGLAVIAAGFRLAFFLMDGDRAGAQLTAAFMGAVAGFLVRNLPPAKVFMGDAGSLFLGFFLSGLCLVSDYSAYSRGIAAVLVLPVLLMLIPIFDTTFVTLTRLITGRPVSQGGRDHTSHRLVGLGITERQALVLLSTVSVLSGLLAVLSYQFGFTYTVVLLALLLIGLCLLGVHLGRVQVVAPGMPRAEGPIVRLVADFPFKRHVATVSMDLVLIVIAYYAAYLLRFEVDFEQHREAFLGTVAPVIVLQISSLALFGSYRGLWQYTSLPDLLRLIQGATVGVGATVLYFVFVTGLAGLSRAVFVLDWLLLVVLLGASRVSSRLLGEMLHPARDDFRRVLIYGAGDGGELMLRELRKNPALRRQPVGFLDDDRSKVGTRIHEVPVLGGLDRADDLLAAHRVVEVIVASRKIPGDRLRALEAVCASRGVSIIRGSLRLESAGGLP
jgi:UDP-GlcNAc:undecaprenyl-phosphate/decaprenyl-phosphate GlcNAc-1-phosphate transferase